ncbi:MAG: Trk system potassium transporter TrkA [Victivallaceae bacterium]|nr:Trk system potassium transporter TrkA [Victivallaceae bacterium]
MKIGIVGGGTLGKFLAVTFCKDKHDVVVIDSSSKILDRLREKLDIMTVAGNGASYAVLKEAGIDKVKMFIAVSSDDTINIHACRIARHMGVSNIICRLTTLEYFDTEAGFTPENSGIDYVVVPQEECVHKIINVLDNISTLEKITFSVPEALIAAFTVVEDSPLNNMKLMDFPSPELIRSVRFAAVIRDEELMAPRGDTVIKAGDEIYLAGLRGKVDAMVKWAYPQKKKISRIIIAGGTKTGSQLALELSKQGFDIRLIEKDHDLAEGIMNEINTQMMVINGDPSESDVLEEAGVSTSDVFVAAGEKDESNILSCILAKRMGAKKTIVLTNKEEYVDLVRKMDFIDCGFSRWVVAGNSILRHISVVNQVHTSAILHRADAVVSEFEVKENSAVCDKQIDQCIFPSSTVLSLVFRGSRVLTPYGELPLRAGDLVTAVTTQETEKKLAELFK